MKSNCTLMFPAAALALTLVLSAPSRVDLMADEPGREPKLVQSEPGGNAWNTAKAPVNWHAEIERYHGHVGPWNVLGWRIGQAALRELRSEWGSHELEVVCYVPLSTPFTCLVDGLAIGTGNSQGRLDLRMAEVLAWEQTFVAVRRKDGKGGVLEFRPRAEYLKSIIGRPVEQLEKLSEECGRLPEEKLYEVRRLVTRMPAAAATNAPRSTER